MATISNRLKWYAISSRAFCQYLTNPSVTCVKGPKDGVVVDVRINDIFDTFSLLIDSPEHAELKSGELIPTDGRFVFHKANSQSESDEEKEE